MTSETAVGAARSAAESLMVDSCAITRGTARTLDRTSGTYVESAGSDVYVGACRIKPEGGGRSADAGERQVGLWSYLVSVPFGAGSDIARDDVVTITESRDPALIGLDLTVRQVAQGTHLSARRLSCERVA